MRMKRLDRLKKLYEHRYFVRIFCLSTVSLILLVSLITFAFYTYIDDAVTQNKYQTDMHLLEQVKHNMEISNQFVVDFCTNVYFNSSATNIMRSRQKRMPLNEIILELKKISSSVVSVAPYIHSIYIYNNPDDTYYSTYTGFGTIINDEFLQETIHQYDRVPVLMPLVRKIRAKVLNKEAYTEVFSYFFYETLDTNGRFDGAVIVNIEPEWLLEGISNFSTDSAEKFYLMSANREFIFGDKERVDENQLNGVRAIYYNQIQAEMARGSFSGMIPFELVGEKNMVSYIYMAKEDFVLLKVQSFDSIYASVNQIKVNMLIISSLIILVALLLSFIVSSKIYKPFDKFLLNIARKNPQNESPEHRRIDELGYLENVFIRSVNEISTLKNEITSADIIKQKYYLAQLFINSSTMTDEVIVDLNHSGVIQVDVHDTIILSMLRLDPQNTIDRSLSEITDWCVEVLGGLLNTNYKNDIIDLENGAVVIMISPGKTSETASITALIEQELAKLQKMIQQRYGVIADAAVNDPIRSITDVTECTLSLQKMLAYSFIYGHDAVITSRLIAQNLRATALKYPEQEEKKLLREIKAQNLGMIEPALDELLQKIQGMNYSNIVVSLVRLCTTVRSTIETIKRENFSTSLGATLFANPMEYLTLKDLQAQMFEYIQSGIADDIIVSRHKRMIAAIKEIIKKNYSDPMLCLAGIADSLKISPNYLNHNFKLAFGISVSEHITDFRLFRAAELIETTDESMNVIMIAVGIENESFFYKRFKEKYGTTPKNYKTARLCDQFVKVE